jgi:1-pyrroline-5-carboxylate dehydrogenase
MMGNTAIWKPSSTALLSNFYIMKILAEAGLPKGVVNFLPGPSQSIAPALLRHRDFAGIHFTGSTAVFNSIWRNIGTNLDRYRGYPRIVGETGGKDFVFAHADTDPAVLATALVRGAFEYQGQKCSAASRAYIPRSLWSKTKQIIGEQLASIRVGEPTDFTCFVNAVIDAKSFQKITGYIERAKKSPDCEIVFGGKYSSEDGYFIHPTVIETKNPHYESMVEEIFGPVLSVFIYEDSKYEETLSICESSAPYALTGAFLSRNKAEVARASEILRHAAGNFYINDKPTGAVVGQQPFGGARASGTNDKAGSLLNLVRCTSPRTIKETFSPATDYRYPFLS